MCLSELSMCVWPLKCLVVCCSTVSSSWTCGELLGCAHVCLYCLQSLSTSNDFACCLYCAFYMTLRGWEVTCDEDMVMKSNCFSTLFSLTSFSCFLIHLIREIIPKVLDFPARFVIVEKLLLFIQILIFFSKYKDKTGYINFFSDLTLAQTSFLPRKISIFRLRSQFSWIRYRKESNSLLLLFINE